MVVRVGTGSGKNITAGKIFKTIGLRAYNESVCRRELSSRDPIGRPNRQ